MSTSGNPIDPHDTIEAPFQELLPIPAGVVIQDDSIDARVAFHLFREELGAMNEEELMQRIESLNFS